MPLGPTDQARIGNGLTPSQAIHKNKSMKGDYLKLVLAIIGIVVVLFIMVSLLSSPTQYKVYGYAETNVTVTIRNTETSESVNVATDENGYYEINLNEHFSEYMNVLFMISADGQEDTFTPSPSDDGVKVIDF